MADELKRICTKLYIVIILCLVPAIPASSPAATDRDRGDHRDGAGTLPVDWSREAPIRLPEKGIRLRINCAAVDTLVVNIECPETGPRALSLKRIRCKRQVSVSAGPDGARHDHRRAVREKPFRPPPRATVLRAVLSGMTRLVIAVLGMVFF